MMRFDQVGNQFFTFLRADETDQCLAYVEREGPHAIGVRLVDEVVDWLDDNEIQGWEEDDEGAYVMGYPAVTLKLSRPEDCVAFQLRWG